MKVIAIAMITVLILLCCNEIGHIYQQQTEGNYTTTMLTIPAIGLHQVIQDESLDKGVYLDHKSSNYGEGPVILFAHRILYGSPFYRLDELKSGDNVNIHSITTDVNYIVNNKLIVSPDYVINITEQRNVLFMVTCNPVGSTKERLIIECVNDD